MKAKVILSALAMPVLFAACSSDELVPMEQGQGQQARPTLSKDFVIKTTAEGMKQDTRYAINQTSGGTLKFSNTGGDKFGVTTVDTYNADETPEKWDINGWQGGGNYPFTFNEGTQEWSSPFRVGIGHNIFMFPYNEYDNARGAVEWSLPTIQWLVDKVDATTGEPTADSKYDINGAVVRGNKAVAGAVFDDWNRQDYGVKVRNLFAYPMFRVVIDNQFDIRKISRVVLEMNDGTANGFLVGGGLDHQGIFNIYDAGEDNWKDGTQYADLDSEWEEVTETGELVLEDDGSNVYSKKVATPQHSRYIVVNIPESEQAVKEDDDNNKYVDVRFMMPGYKTSDDGKMTGGNTLNMYVYTDKGVWEIKDVMASLKFSESTTPETKQRLLARNSSYWMTTDHDKAKYQKDAPHIVTSVGDWNAYVAQYGKNTNYTASSAFKVNLLGGFVLTSECDMPSKAIFEIVENEAHVAAAGTVEQPYVMNNLLVKKLVIENGAVVSFGNAFKADEVNNKGGLVFQNRATGAYTDPIRNNIVNEGTITIGASTQVTIDGIENTSKGAINNNGTKAIMENMTNQGVITNNTLMFFKDNTVNNAATTDLEAGLIVNNKELDGNAKLVNKGKIEQNAYMHDVVGFTGGLVEVGSDAGITEMQDALNVIDITKKWGADVRYNTNVKYINLAYSINTDDTKTIDALMKKGLTEITLNGGTIEGTTGEDIESTLTKAFTVTAAGGTIKGEGTSKNTVSAGTNVVLKGIVTLNKIAFADEIIIQEGTTTIAGNVNANGGIVMGKETSNPTKRFGATLNVDEGVTLNTKYLKSGTNNLWTKDDKMKNVVTNEGTIFTDTKNGGATEIDITTFKWNEGAPTNNGAPDAYVPQMRHDAQYFMNKAVAAWAGEWYDWLSQGAAKADYYAGNPYSYDNFANLMLVGKSSASSWNTYYSSLIAGETAYNTDGDYDTGYGTADIFEKENGEWIDPKTDDFKKAVNTFFTKDNDTNTDGIQSVQNEAKAVLFKADGSYKGDKITRGELYETEALAEQNLLESLVLVGRWASWGASTDKESKRKAAQLSAYVWYEYENKGTAEYSLVWTEHKKANPYGYIWTGCQLDEVIDVIMMTDRSYWMEIFGITSNNEAGSLFGYESTNAYMTTMTHIQNWMKYAGNAKDETGNGVAAKKIYEKYGQAVKAWTYSTDQIKACK